MVKTRSTVEHRWILGHYVTSEIETRVNGDTPPPDGPALRERKRRREGGGVIRARRVSQNTYTHLHTQARDSKWPLSLPQPRAELRSHFPSLRPSRSNARAVSEPAFPISHLEVTCAQGGLHTHTHEQTAARQPGVTSLPHTASEPSREEELRSVARRRWAEPTGYSLQVFMSCFFFCFVFLFPSSFRNSRLVLRPIPSAPVILSSSISHPDTFKFTSTLNLIRWL